MRAFAFATVDVFTERRFGGNPLAVFTDARGLADAEMQALAAELNLSETAFVLPPADAAHTARVRIFGRTAEMPFAGHPLVGTAYVLAAARDDGADAMTFELPAGLATARPTRGADGAVVGATVDAPRPLELEPAFAAADVAACVGLDADDVVADAHAPVTASVGSSYVIAEVRPAALARAAPDAARFRATVAARPWMHGRLSLHLYARAGGHLRARMFAPLAGTAEDPATGGANAALAALLLSLGGAPRLATDVVQGVELGRPSRLVVAAWRAPDGIRASVGGGCVPVLRGEAVL